MRPSSDLRVLHGRIRRRLKRLRTLADESSQRYPDYPSKPVLAFVTTEAQNSWSEFCRAYFLSTLLRARKVGGGRLASPLAPGVPFNDAIDPVVKKFKKWKKGTGPWGRHDEPSWHVPATFRACCEELKFASLPVIDVAFSAGSSAFDDLRIFRNYVCHRNEPNAERARSRAAHYVIATTDDPIEILTKPPFGRTHPLLVDWIDDLLIASEILCE